MSVERLRALCTELYKTIKKLKPKFTEYEKPF